MWSDPRKEIRGDECCAVLLGERTAVLHPPFTRDIDSALHPRICWPQRVVGIWSSIFPWLAHMVSQKALASRYYRMRPPPGMKGHLEKMAKSCKESLLLRETALNQCLPDGAYWSPLMPPPMNCGNCDAFPTGLSWKLNEMMCVRFLLQSRPMINVSSLATLLLLGV